MQRSLTWILTLVGMIGLVSCGGEDPDVRRGNLFFKNRQYYEAYQAYEKAMARNPKVFENKELRDNFKNAYYYYGGSREINDSVDAAVKYYEKGFDLVPQDAGICDKLAKYYWGNENFEKAAKYFGRLVELDAQAPDTKGKWRVLGEDYYALGYSLYKIKKYPEALEALEQSLKASPKGAMVPQAKSARESIRYEMKKSK